MTIVLYTLTTGAIRNTAAGTIWIRSSARARGRG
jgi:hypothetical protein